ncbi:MAG TPA: response regulator [Hyphomicrobium sp.]|nr:response regulator [Hyphomicrobium sp.]
MKHILIVDDSPIIRKFGRLIFENLGFRVSEAESAVETLHRARTDPPGYILVDWIIPGVNSHELIQKLRRECVEVRPYIIYLVTENDVPDVTKAFKAGADDYLLKPFNRDIIEMKLHEIQVAA